jgi:hypothetical protein
VLWHGSGKIKRWLKSYPPKNIKKAPPEERVALLIFCGLATWRLVLRGRRKIIEAKKVAVAEHDIGRIGQQGRQKF